MPTLLIIDDNESVRESLKHVFMRRGYSVAIAPGGEAGLTLHAKGGIDAALVDINMPGMNGIDVCRMMHRQMEAEGRKIPVWLMTGAIGPNAEEMGMAAGAQAVMHKPFDILAFTRDLDAQLAAGASARANSSEKSA
jgi:CheY-like chemotaxis protein